MPKNRVVITNNSSKYIYRFKKNLIKALNGDGYSVFIVAPYDEYSPRLSELGVKYESIEMETNGLNPFKDLIYMWNLAKIYKKINPFANLLFTIK